MFGNAWKTNSMDSLTRMLCCGAKSHPCVSSSRCGDVENGGDATNGKQNSAETTEMAVGDFFHDFSHLFFWKTWSHGG